MMSVTATQDTVRPWNDGNETGVPGTWETKSDILAAAPTVRPRSTPPSPSRLPRLTQGLRRTHQQWPAPPGSSCALLLSYRLSLYLSLWSGASHGAYSAPYLSVPH